jgi:hypothetical protein
MTIQYCCEIITVTWFELRDSILMVSAKEVAGTLYLVLRSSYCINIAGLFGNKPAYLLLSVSQNSQQLRSSATIMLDKIHVNEQWDVSWFDR